MCPGGAGGAPKNSVTISTLPFNVMLLFVATFDMAHETVRSEALSDKLRSAARRLPPGLRLHLGRSCRGAAGLDLVEVIQATDRPLSVLGIELTSALVNTIGASILTSVLAKLST